MEQRRSISTLLAISLEQSHSQNVEIVRLKKHVAELLNERRQAIQAETSRGEQAERVTRVLR
jgi:hypothetical protein